MTKINKHNHQPTVADSEIVERDGKLYVLSPWENDFSDPIQTRLAWPTGLSAQDYPHLIGQTAKACLGGNFRLANFLLLRLERGEKTLPDPRYGEKRPVKKPSGCREYRNGRWVC